jgi:hypothetical protein
LKAPPNQRAVQEQGINSRWNVVSLWQEFFTSVFNVITSLQQSGTTAQRPTKGLWVGMPYFDTTLGYQINLLSVSPNVWVNGAGTIV